jgi:hypothetical protein
MRSSPRTATLLLASILALAIPFAATLLGGCGDDDYGQQLDLGQDLSVADSQHD